MRTPYLLLDVDGVLIPFPADDGSTPASHVRHDVVPAGRRADDPVAVWLNPEHGPLLMDVFRTGLVNPVWCTSWLGEQLIATTLRRPKDQIYSLVKLCDWRGDFHFVDSCLKVRPTG